MKKEFDFVITGYPSLDSIVKINQNPKLGETSIITNEEFDEKFLGGCCVNIAYSLAKLGHKVLPLFKVGCDFESSGFKDFLRQAGIDLSGIKQDKNYKTSSTQILENQNGDHFTLFYPGAMKEFNFDDMDSRFIEKSRIGVLTVGEPNYNDQFIENCLYYDIPIAAGLKGDLNAFPKGLLYKIAYQSNLLFMNQYEKKILDNLLGRDSVQELLYEGRAQILVITKGSQGCTIHHKEKRVKEYFIPAVNSIRVVDSTGVGDAFIAGFLHAYINNQNIDICGKYATSFASFVLESNGSLTNIPKNIEIKERFIKNFGEEETCKHYI